MNKQTTPANRITVKVECDNGDHWTTGFNGSFAEAEEYFLGKTFVSSDEVTQQRVVRVLLLEGGGAS